MVSELIFLTFLISSLFSINECADHIPIESNQSHKHPTKAIVILTGSNGVSGQVTFQQTDTFESMKITGTISGLSAGLHGFHVHQYGNLVNGCTSAGSHFNPMSYNHSAQTEQIRHAGDLGNIEANENGEAVVNISDDILTLEGKNSILGRAVVVHALPDDLGKGGNADSLTTGNAGTRLACGIVGLAEEGLISLKVVG